MAGGLDITILGLSITSSWGNGHATTYRSLVRALAEQGHRILFLERDVPWYAQHRDLPRPPYCETELYSSHEELRETFGTEIRESDLVIVGSYVPEGVPVGDYVTQTAGGVAAFYDIDTPVTLAKLRHRDYEYLSPELIARYDLYLSFTGGPTLGRLERQYGSPMARALYCSFDPEMYYPESTPLEYDLGYLGTYSADRQPTVNRLLVSPAKRWTEGRFVVAGPLYPENLSWPENVERISHVPPKAHRGFYNSQRFTLNVTRRDMRLAGYSPSVRLFESAACGVPIISDSWPGLEEFFTPDKELLVASTAGDVLRILQEWPEERRRKLAGAARRRALVEHTAAHRAATLVQLTRAAMSDKCRR